MCLGHIYLNVRLKVPRMSRRHFPCVRKRRLRAARERLGAGAVREKFSGSGLTKTKRNTSPAFFFQETPRRACCFYFFISPPLPPFFVGEIKKRKGKKTEKKMQGSAYGASLAGGAFDLGSFVKQPQTALRCLSWVSETRGDGRRASRGATRPSGLSGERWGP